jgi:hypothetical protein
MVPSPLPASELWVRGNECTKTRHKKWKFSGASCHVESGASRSIDITLEVIALKRFAERSMERDSRADGAKKWQFAGHGSTAGNTAGIPTRSVSEGNPNPRLRFGLL